MLSRAQKRRLLFLDILGINTLYRYLNRNKAIILGYHGVCNDDFDLLRGYDERHIPKKLFRKQLRYLKQKGYVFVTMSELLKILKNKKEIKKHVVITFDDGFGNVVENAYPIMKEFNAKGCFYLVSNLIGGKKMLWTDYIETLVRNTKKEVFQFIFKGRVINYKLDTKKSYEEAMRDVKRKLKTIPDRERKEYIKQFNNKRLDVIPKEFIMPNLEQIRNLDRRILEVGSHTKNHPNCANLDSEEEYEEEIRDSKIDIERMVSYEIDHFSYPAGSYNDEVVEKIRRYGYKTAVINRPGFNDRNTDLYKLKRIGVTESFLLFKASISGSIFHKRPILRLFVVVIKKVLRGKKR